MTLAQQVPPERPEAVATNTGRKSQQHQSGGRNHKARKPARLHANDAGRIASTTVATMSMTGPSLESITVAPEQRQDEPDRLAVLKYKNTPPLFVTSTRDFYIDVARHSAGYKLTTIQAIDMEGDQLEYSIQPARLLDASPYFSINSTSGELRLTTKRIFEPRQQQQQQQASDRDDDDDESGAEAVVRLDEQQEQQSHGLNIEGHHSQLYFLNVAAWDGEYSSVIELKIHVSNLTQFGTNPPVLLAPEGGSMTSVMRAKTLDFFNNLYPSSANQSRQVLDNSTIVLPSFVNPPLIGGPRDTSSPSNGVGQAVPIPNRVFHEPKPADANNQNNNHNNNNDPKPLQSLQIAQIETNGPRASAESARAKQHTALVVEQPMLLSIMIVVFACLIIAFVILVFVVPISVRRLKRRLKNMEMQHEQLSHKASNGDSSIMGSCLSSHGGGGSSVITNSMTTSGTIGRDGCHGLPSSLSQFTLASSDRSCAIMPTAMHRHGGGLSSNHQTVSHFRRAPLCRQSSLDSAIANNTENYNSSQFTLSNHMSGTPQSYFVAASTMATNAQPSQQQRPSGNIQITCLTNRHQQQCNNNNNNNNGLNRINNGSIVNPVYLHRTNGGGPDPSRFEPTDNIYCPIDEEFYSTINTESSAIDDRIAEHNYKLYTRQRDELVQSQANGLLDHHQVGSLVGQTCDFSNYIAAGSAQPSRFLADDNQQGRAKSPSSSISSRSSTRSLARFLSLPARHLSHQTNESINTAEERDLDSQKAERAILNELDIEFKASVAPIDRLAPKVSLDDQQLAKTIARADRIGDEQQVRHKRDKHQDQSHKSMADDRWEIERHKLRFLNIVDEGQFGLVFRGKLKLDPSSSKVVGTKGLADRVESNELTVAVKTLKGFAAKDAREIYELLAEIEIMKLVCNHPNVVRILHCCTRDISPTRPILLIMEYVELGKLQSFLEKSRANHLYATSPSLYSGETSGACSRRLQRFNGDSAPDQGQDYRAMSSGSVASSSLSIVDEQQEKDSIMHQLSQSRLTSRDLIKFIYHVAKGMEHISSNCIVHRDLASRNILISSQRVCKIGDFGMARHMESMGDVYERHSRNAKIPVRWMAPEVLLNNSFTTKSDVFSFGILMWEIVTLGSTPYRHLKTDQIIQAVARNGERPERPEYCHELLYDIMSSCWSADPAQRPSFSQLVGKLDGLLMSTEEYIQLDQYPDHNYYNISQTAAPFELL
jgi:serine/threonine protein kinase